MYSMIYSFPFYIAGTTDSVGVLECECLLLIANCTN